MSKYPAIPSPIFLSSASTFNTVQALKQVVELLVGHRGDGSARALIQEDMVQAVNMQLTEFTLATLPLASDFPRRLVYVSDAVSNQHVVVSDGSVWRYMDGTAV